MAEDKRDRRARIPGDFDLRRFEQEVAEEIGVSLRQKGRRRGGGARGAAASPAASEVLSGQEGTPPRPE
ncbi:MAG TPA: hypothetical protein DGR79_04105 [Clostridiales bacterium]|nr:hypothetical protein [Clostridiales bacterium]